MRSRHRTGCALRKSVLPFGQIVFLALAAWPCYEIGVLTIAGNFRVVIPGRIYRSGQPGAGQLEAWIGRYNLRTIVNLRGSTSPRADEEEAIADATGVRLVHIALTASRPMTRKQLQRVIGVLDTAEEPMLIHCAQGIDRSGTVSALAAWLIGGEPYDEARWQAYVPPGPWKNKRGFGHISDTLDSYEAYCQSIGEDRNDAACFRRWAADIYYDSQGYMAERLGLDTTDPNDVQADGAILADIPSGRPKQAAAAQ